MKPPQPDNLPAAIPKAGEIFAAKYRVERLLGAGGMGVVVAASHLGLGQLVAIKLMLPDLAQSAEFSARFLREARAAAAIRGDHAVRIFDVATAEDGMLYMVMELLEGEDLGQILKRRGALPIAEAVDYLLQACDALGDAHAQGIVHRDLKPGNLFLALRRKGSPVIKVLDFGISKSNSPCGAPSGPTLTVPDTMLGTPYYMSPEQFRSAKTVDARTDIWSLGLILHKLITGFSAFESDSVREHISMIAADPPAPLRLRRPDAPAGLEAVVLRCLEKDASLRFQTVSDFVTALAPFAPPRPGSELLVAPPDPVATLPPAPQPLSRNAIATPTGVGAAGAPELQTATSVTSSGPRAPAQPKATARALFKGILVVGALTLGVTMAVRYGSGEATTTTTGRLLASPPAPSTVSSPATSSAAALPLAAPEPVGASRGAVEPAPNASVSVPALTRTPPLSARSTQAPVIMASAPPPPLRTSSSGAPVIKVTPRLSLTAFQPSDL